MKFPLTTRAGEKLCECTIEEARKIVKFAGLSCYWNGELVQAIHYPGA